MTKALIFLFLLIIPFFSFSQGIIEELIPVDTSSIAYQVVYKETLVNGYFSLERYVFADDTSTIAIEKNTTNGVQNGITRVYYPSGKLRIKAIYGSGKLQGEWTLYDEEGIIITKGVYNYGIKHGYWAYKSIGTYGRYVKGKKHRNWKKKDKNGVKHKAWYWRGEFKRGEDIFNEDFITYGDTAYVAKNEVDTNVVIKAVNVDERYISAIKYLAENYYFRKVTKDYFRPNKKTRKEFVDDNVDYKKDVFKFQVASEIVPININYFLQQKKLLKVNLDSLIKANGNQLREDLMSFQPKTEQELVKLSTDKNAKVIIYVTEIKDSLIVLEVLEKTSIDGQDFTKTHSNTNNIRMKVLLLLDEDNKVVEAEYEARDW